MRVKIIAALMCLLVIGVALVVYTRMQRDVDYSSDIYIPYAWGHGPKEDLTLEALGDSEHPLKETGELFKRMRVFNDDPDEAIAFADRLIEKYSLLVDESPILAYPFTHGIFPEGWHSGMGNFFLSFLLFDLQDLTGNQRYAEAAVNLFNSSIKEMRDGGVIIQDEEGCHLVEYASPKVPYDKALFVLNGHLHALQSLIMLQRYPEVRRKAKEIYECAVEKTKKVAPRFHSEGYSYYQLNPSHVNQISYLIYEMMQFKALFSMTSDPFYGKEAEYRRGILKSAYPIRYIRNGAGYKYLVSLISFPHPYLLETFQTTLECVGETSKRRYQVDNLDKSSVLTKAFLQLNVDEKLKDCRLSSKYGVNEFLLYEDAVGGEQINSELPIKLYSITARAHNDASQAEGRIVIHPESKKENVAANAIVELHLEQPMILGNTDLPYMRVCTDSDSFRPVLRIRNTNNKTLLRYWPVIKGVGCKVVIFSLLGFHDYETDNFKTLTMVGFSISTSDKATYEMNIPEIGVISNPFQLHQLVSHPDNLFGVTP